MIVYHPELGTNFSLYGILVPIVDDRSDRAWGHLKLHFHHLQETSLSAIEALTKEDLLLAHDEKFVTNLFDENQIESEIIKCYELVDENGRYHRYNPDLAQKKLSQMLPEILLKGGASVLAMEQALQKSFCFYLGGGMHHAMSFGGRGFCPVNDIVVGIRKLQKQNKIKQAWVIDVDAHKGDGTAELTQGDSTIKSMSIHMQSGWPLDGPEKDSNGNPHPWYLPNDLDVPVASGDEDLYIKKLQFALNEMENNWPKPDIVVVVAGADPYEKDVLPSTNKLRLTKEQMLERDLLVFDFLRDRSIPQTWLMAGGYGPDSHEIYSQFLEKALLLMR